MEREAEGWCSLILWMHWLKYTLQCITTYCLPPAKAEVFWRRCKQEESSTVEPGLGEPAKWTEAWWDLPCGISGRMRPAHVFTKDRAGDAAWWCRTCLPCPRPWGWGSGERVGGGLRSKESPRKHGDLRKYHICLKSTCIDNDYVQIANSQL